MSGYPLNCELRGGTPGCSNYQSCGLRDNTNHCVSMSGTDAPIIVGINIDSNTGTTDLPDNAPGA